MQGKMLSILGDSISTYKGISDDKDTNATLIYNPYYYREPFPAEKTYWHRAMSALGLTLCTNNSYSGGNLSGYDDPYSGVNRAGQLSRDSGETPDIIIVFMGINDLGRNVAITDFKKAYSSVLTTIKREYPDAAVCCVNLPDRDIFLKKRTELFNTVIKNTVGVMGKRFFVADLFGSRLRGDFYYMNTLDGLHPDEDGMAIIAEVVIKAISENAM